MSHKQIRRRLPLSRHPQIQITPADLRELAMTAGRKGRTAEPMTEERRVAGYHQQNTGRRLRLFQAPKLTPAQERRSWKKARRLMAEADLAAVLRPAGAR